MWSKKPIFCTFLLIVTLHFIGCSQTDPQSIPKSSVAYQNGDILFRRGGSALSMCVQMADKKGIYTHIGLVVAYQDTLYALHTVPDEAPKNDFDRVKIEPIDAFFAESKALNGAVYRSPLTKEQLEIVTQEALRYYRLKIPFDHDFNLSDSNQLYCTELIYRCFQKTAYDITEGNFTELDMPFFRGPFIFPSDILKNTRLDSIYSF